jgi:hypothetical protein
VAGVLAVLVATAGTINLSAGSEPSKGASIGMAAPFVVTLAMGEKALTILDSWKAWPGRNNAA